MIHEDTIKLLKECDAGIKRGVNAIDEVLPDVKSERLKAYLIKCKSEHEKLGAEMESLLNEYHDEGKNPNPIASGMSFLKTNIKMMMDKSDETIADLMTDGCNMGVKSLNKYLNEYKAAEEKVKDITKRLINLEEKLAIDVRSYL